MTVGMRDLTTSVRVVKHSRWRKINLSGPGTIVVLALAVLYFLFGLDSVRVVTPEIQTVFAPDLVAHTIGDPSFLIFAVLSVWIVVSLVDAFLGVRDESLMRCGSRNRIVLRVGIMDGTALAAVWVGAIYFLFLLLAFAIVGGGDVRIYPDLPAEFGAVTLLHLAHAVKLVLFLVVVRAFLVVCALVSRWPAIAAGVVVWLLAASGRAFPELIPDPFNPASQISLVARFMAPELQIRGVCTIILIGVGLWAGTRTADAFTGDAPKAMLVKLRHPIEWFGSAPALGAFGLLLIAVVAGSSSVPGALPEPAIGAVLLSLFGGFQSTLVQALLEVVFSLGFVWWTMLKEDQRQQSGWAEAVLIRRGSGRRAFLHRLSEQASSLALYVATVCVTVIVVFGAVSGNFGAHEEGPGTYQSVVHLLFNGTGQIFIYLTIMNLVRAISPARTLSLISLGVLIALPAPGIVPRWVPLHRFGIAPIAEGGWDWILAVAAQNAVVIAVLLTLGYVFADGVRGIALQPGKKK